MFRFKRAKILPFFLQKQMTVSQLARKAGVAYISAQRAVDGEKVAAPIISKVAAALNIDAMEFLDGENKTPLHHQKIITITDDDGSQKDVTIYVDDSDNLRGYWGEDNDALKAYQHYRAGFIGKFDWEEEKRRLDNGTARTL